MLTDADKGLYMCLRGGAQDPARKVGDERVHMERNGGWVGHPVTGGQARWVDGAEANTAPTTIRPLHSQ